MSGLALYTTLLEVEVPVDLCQCMCKAGEEERDGERDQGRKRKEKQIWKETDIFCHIFSKHLLEGLLVK